MFCTMESNRLWEPVFSRKVSMQLRRVCRELPAVESSAVVDVNMRWSAFSHR